MNGMKLYTALSGSKGPKSYVGKILLVAFLGTHIPLLTLLAHFIITASLSTEVAARALTVALVATLAGTGITLWALHNLLLPIQITSHGLRQYLREGMVPNLPTGFTDDVGILMADTHQTVQKVDSMLRTLTSYDNLTGLPNRTLFLDRVTESLSEKRRQGDMFAVMVLDVSGLTGVNNHYGRGVGDLLLKAIVDRMSRQVGQADVFSRIGNDEFALLCTEVDSLDTVSLKAKNLLQAVEAPFVIDNHTIKASLSLGIAVHPSDAGTAQELLGNAEVAQQQVKTRRNNNGDGESDYGYYSAEFNEKLRRQIELENDLHGALERNELSLHYQPQVDNCNGQVVGVEALLRWKHPLHGYISPGEFVPIAERTDLILHIGEWVLRTACRQNKAWQDSGLPPFRMGINLSVRQFQHQKLVDLVAQVIEETGLAPQWIDLEVTESMAMEDVQQSVEILQRLRDLGVFLSLDDFGTGYSSLSYLKSLPVQTLKIDRSFVSEVSDDPQGASITNTIIALAHSLQMSVIAEGVETDEQLDYLRIKGCELSQGFLFSRPLPSGDLSALLHRTSSLLNRPVYLK